MTTQQHKTQNESGQIHEIATLIQIALRSKGGRLDSWRGLRKELSLAVGLRVTVVTNGEEEALWRFPDRRALIDCGESVSRKSSIGLT